MLSVTTGASAPSGKPPPPELRTALITGASSGIGLALAHEFAAHGHDLVLVARHEERLAQLAAELTARHGCRATVLPCDLTDPVATDALLAELVRQGIQVDVLVSNAGFAIKGAFATTDLAAETAMVELQLNALLRLAKALVPGMLGRGRGGLLTVASVYSFAPVAFQAVYGACKAFLLSFSEALASEGAGRGLKVTVLCPGSTRTEFRQRAGHPEEPPGGKGMAAERVAAAGYAGLMRGQRIVVPGTANRVFVALARVVPGAAITAVLRKINRYRGMVPKAH